MSSEGFASKESLCKKEYHKHRDERVNEIAERLYRGKFVCYFEDDYRRTVQLQNNTASNTATTIASLEGKSGYPMPDIRTEVHVRRVFDVVGDLETHIGACESLCWRSAQEAVVLRPNTGSTICALAHIVPMGPVYYGTGGKL